MPMHFFAPVPSTVRTPSGAFAGFGALVPAFLWFAGSVAAAPVLSPSPGPALPTGLVAPTDAAEPLAADAALRFSIPEGSKENHFFRRGPVAAHLIASSGLEPRLIVAFPAGNTGAGLWFGRAEKPVRLVLAEGSRLEGVARVDGMRGITAHLRSDAGTLAVRSVVLANLRSIRDYIAGGMQELPRDLAVPPPAGSPLVWHRTTVDGRHHIELRLAGEEGTVVTTDAQGIRRQAGASGGIAVAVTTLTDESPLTPFAPDQIFTADAADRPLDRAVFAFLASEEKFTAGSWRFLTYFGRDTLLTLQLLMPALQPAVVEAALGSVIERLGPAGEVAHEEGIGEFAVRRNLTLSPRPADLATAELDYKMIDGEFLLAPAVAAHLLDSPAGRVRATAFLLRKTADGETYASRLRRNLALVLARTAAFAVQPRFENLLVLKEGIPVGNWRDSDHGLGGGRYPYDVNGALAPAALQAAARLYWSGLLGEAAAQARQAEQGAKAWETAGSYFRVVVPAPLARRRVSAYATALQLDPAAAVAAIDRPVAYHAVALDAVGKPVPVMNTDEGFALFFTAPPPEQLAAVARHILHPFPAGLRMAVGLAVANPAYGEESTQRSFTRNDYHGTVVWSWQQALMAAGLQRQLARSDLPAATRADLAAAERALWAVISRLQAQSAGELWSWEPAAGAEGYAPYGQATGHADESNAAQLWSTVYLAVKPQPPAR